MAYAENVLNECIAATRDTKYIALKIVNTGMAIPPKSMSYFHFWPYVFFS